MKQEEIKKLFMQFRPDSDVPIPLYYQIQQFINTLIENGKLEPGERIPTEDELMELWGVSRITIRQAIQNLSNAGKLIKFRNKGTFVTEHRDIIFNLANLRSFSQEMKSRGFSIKDKVLENIITKPTSEIADKLKINKNEKIFKLKRLRIVEGIPSAIETTHIPLKLFPGIDSYDFSQNSLFFIFENVYKVKLSHSEHIVTAVNAERVDALLLKIKPGSALIKTEGVTYLKDGTPVEYILGLYCGDRYRLKIMLTGGK